MCHVSSCCHVSPHRNLPHGRVSPQPRNRTVLSSFWIFINPAGGDRHLSDGLFCLLSLIKKKGSAFFRRVKNRLYFYFCECSVGLLVLFRCDRQAWKMIPSDFLPPSALTPCNSLPTSGSAFNQQNTAKMIGSFLISFGYGAGIMGCHSRDSGTWDRVKPTGGESSPPARWSYRLCGDARTRGKEQLATAGVWGWPPADGAPSS